MKRCVIVGAGEFDAESFRADDGDYLIAADAGLLHLRRIGRIPRLLIGDMDSLEELGVGALHEDCQMTRLPREKDDTDMLAAIKAGLAEGCDSFWLYGGTGGRLDHTLANIQCLLYLALHGAHGVICGAGYRLELLRNARREYGKECVGRISVLAYGGTARGVTVRGLRYELEKAELTCDFPIGTSNEYIGRTSSIEVTDGMLLIYTEGSAC